MKVLCLCTGNLFRSIIAEVIGRTFGFDTRSAGVSSHIKGRTTPSIVVSSLRESGYVFKPKQAQQVSNEMFQWADRIFYMQPSHFEFMKLIFQEDVFKKTNCLGAFLKPPVNRIPDPAFKPEILLSLIQMIETCFRNFVSCSNTVEEWRPLKRTKMRYAVSNMGRLKRLFDKFPPREDIFAGRILTPTRDAGGYIGCVLFDSVRSKWTSMKMHHLVLEEFEGPRNGRECNHEDGVKWRNYIGNIRWCSRKENVNHAIETGLGFRFPIYKGADHGRAKLTWENVRSIRRRAKAGEDRKILAKELGVNVSTVCSIINRRTWK